MLSALGLSPKAPCTEAWPTRLQHHQTENLSSETEAMGWAGGRRDYPASEVLLPPPFWVQQQSGC